MTLLVVTAGCAGPSGPTDPAGDSSSISANATTSAAQTTDSALPLPSAPAPVSPVAVRTTHPAATRVYTPAAAPAPKTKAPQPAPTTAQARSCYPLTNGGNCYEPGEYCRKDDHGTSGIAGDGAAIVCEDDNGWRWERG